MASVRKPVREELDQITRRLAGFKQASKRIGEMVATLKARYLELAPRHIEQVGASRVWDVKDLGMRTRVTQPEAPAPSMDYNALMHKIGPEVFARVCKVTGAILDVDLWNEALAAEQVTDQDLLDCMGEPGKAPRPSVLVEAIPKDKS